MGFRIFLAVALTMFNLLQAADSPEKVYRVTYIQKSQEWYYKQAALWEKILQQDKFSEEAWMNYYKAHRYAKFDIDKNLEWKRQERLDSIITEMKKYIPDSYTYYYLSALNATHVDQIDIKSMEYAHNRWPEYNEILYELILYHEVKGNIHLVNKYMRELYACEDIARGLVEYNANVLLSTQPHSILFTNGDNDTYPALMIQKVDSFRKDVTIINIHLAFTYREYLDRLLNQQNLHIGTERLSKIDITEFFVELVEILSERLPDKNIYMSLTLNKMFIDLFKENLYLVGLAYQYSSKRIHNLALLKDNIQKHLRLDYLSHDWYSEKYPAAQLITKLNQNYIVIFMNLAEYLSQHNMREEAQYYKERALQLATKCGNEKIVQEIENTQFQ
jgi:hypothetical protein